MGNSLIPDDYIARAALDLGFITLDQLQEARTKLKAMAKLNLPARLEEVLERSGALTPQQLKEVRRSLGIQSLNLPGYQILSKIGAGGMGTVYKAHQLSVDRQVAVKVLPPQFTEDHEFVKRFMNEAKAAAKLCHPNIIAVYDAGEADGTYYLTMEFAEGAPLDQVLKAQGTLPESRVRDIAWQMGQALRIIHAHHMQHRDIKPNNILIDKRGKIKLCDFGLARAQTTGTQHLTQSGEIMGTPAYMSPEQVNGEKAIDIRSDLYSLGATLFCLLTGRPPFEAETAMALALKHVSEPAPDPRSINPTISPFMSKLILRLLEKDPKKRFQTPDEYIVALNACYTMRRERPKRLKKIGLVGSTLIVVAIAATIAIWPKEGPLAQAVDWVAIQLGMDPEYESLKADVESDEYERWVRAESRLKDETLKKIASAKIKAVHDAMNAANQKFAAKDWAGAFSAFQQLKPPPEKRMATCRIELEAVKAFDRLAQLDRERRWAEIIALDWKAFESTTTYADRKKDLDALLQRVSREQSAENLWAQLQTPRDQWDAIAKEFELYQDTQTFLLAKEKLAMMHVDREAAATWNQAHAAYKETRFEEARKLLQKFLFDFVSTEIYKKNKAVGEEMVYRCDIEIRQRREDRAKSILAKLREAREASDWTLVEQGLSDLAPYETTVAAASSVKFLQETRKLLAKSKAVVFHADFESGLEGWRGLNDKGKPPLCESWDEGKEGSRSTRLTFPKADPHIPDDFGGAVAKSLEGLDEESCEIRFWARLSGIEAGPSSYNIHLYILESADKSVEIFTATITLTRAWKEFSIPIDSLQCGSNRGGDGRLNLKNVRQIGFMNGEKTKSVVLIVDSIRVLRPEK